MTTSLQDDQTIIRYIAKKSLDKAGNVIDGNAFVSRPGEQNCPSYNWLECFAGTAAHRLDCIRERRRLKYHKRDRLVSLNVGEARATVQKYKEDSDIIRDPLAANDDYPEDPSHCLMTHIPELNELDAETIGDLLLGRIKQTYPALA